MRIIYLGSPEYAIHPLKYLLENQKDHSFEVVGVVSQEAKWAGRGKKKILKDPAVAQYAKEFAADIEVLQPANINTAESLTALRDLKPDLMITCCYGQILREDFLSIPTRGTINIHPSKLPKYRGAIPVQASLLAGDAVTAVTILFTVKALDAGNIITQKDFTIKPHENADQLLHRLFKESGPMLLDAFNKLEDHSFEGTPQDPESVSHCQKLHKEDGEIFWEKSSQEIYNKYRAYNPWPGVFTFINDHRVVITEMSLDEGEDAGNDDTNVINVLKALKNPGNFMFNKETQCLMIKTLDGVCNIKKLKPVNSKEINAREFWNGRLTSK